MKVEEGDRKLSTLLAGWQVPGAPPELEQRLLQRCRRWTATVATAVAAMAASAGLAGLALLTRRERPNNVPRPAAYAFSLPAMDGGALSLSDLRGRVVVVNFWATWCLGCRVEIPQLANLQQRLGPHGLRVVGISMDEGGWPVVRQYLAARPVNYPVLLGDLAVAKGFGVSTLPVTVLLDRGGRVAHRQVGLIDPEQLESRVRALLAE